MYACVVCVCCVVVTTTTTDNTNIKHYYYHYNYSSLLIFYSSKVGVAVFRLWRAGRFDLVIIDDWLPVHCTSSSSNSNSRDIHTPAFTTSRRGDLWCLLLEKALAKVYASYYTLFQQEYSAIIRDISGEVVLDWSFPSIG